MSLTCEKTYNKKDLMFLPWGAVLNNRSGQAKTPIMWRWDLSGSKTLTIGFGRGGSPYLVRGWFGMHRI